MQELNKDDVIEWLQELGRVYNDQSTLLTELDAAIGDADHGSNMKRGFNAIRLAIPELREKNIHSILKDTGMILIKTVGGSSGPLYGTLFLRMAHALDAEIDKINAEHLVAMFAAGLSGVQERGKASINDKTMIDTLAPAVEAMQNTLDAGHSIPVILESAQAAAEKGMKSTITMIAKKGRASYLGERSVGHQDPGATSAYLMIQVAAEVWGK